MQDLITSFLIQAKECSLPQIGKFSIETLSPELDVANKRFYPSTDKIIFSARPDQHIEELVKYISEKEDESEKEAKEKLKRWCENTKEKLNAGEKITFKSLGTLQKNPSGIIFETENREQFFEPVVAERVIHKNVSHAVLVGDKETTSSVMNQFLNEEEIVTNSSWKVIALILLAIAVIILFVHFYMHSFSFSAIGNENSISSQSPAGTYSQQ